MPTGCSELTFMPIEFPPRPRTPVAPRSKCKLQASSILPLQAPSSIAASKTREEKRREEERRRWRASPPHGPSPSHTHSLTLPLSSTSSSKQEQEEEEEEESSFWPHTRMSFSFHFLPFIHALLLLRWSTPFYMTGHWPRSSFPISFLSFLLLIHRPSIFTIFTGESLALFYKISGCAFIF